MSINVNLVYSFLFIVCLNEIKTYPQQIQVLQRTMESVKSSRRRCLLKQNCSQLANRTQAKSKLSTFKTDGNTQIQAQKLHIAPQLIQSQQKIQSKKVTRVNLQAKKLLTRKHIYNNQQTTQILDQWTGKNEFKSKSKINYLMGDFNEIVKMGDNLVNVFDPNQYHHTQWESLEFGQKECSTLKTENTFHNQQRKQRKSFRILQKLVVTKSEELAKNERKTKAKRQSKSSDCKRSQDKCSIDSKSRLAYKC